MELVAPAVIFLILIGAFVAHDRISRPRASDAEAVESYVRGRGMSITSITTSHNYWRYWLRGKLLLSNVSRMYVVDVVGESGERRRFHLAFDPMRKAEGLILHLDEAR